MHKRALANANVFIVRVNEKACPKAIDATVSAAIGNADIGSVILTTMRSMNEAKLERDLQHKSKSGRYNQSPQRRRKLEENENDDGDSDFEAGIYFVNFSPNIFAGFLFFLFFVFITYTGISCMGMIANDNVYTKVYPAIGREA